MKTPEHILLAGLLCLAVSCGRQVANNPAIGTSDTSPILATVSGERVTVAEFQRELDRRSQGSPGAFSSRESREALLGEMIRSKAALARARASGFDRDPETAALIEKLIATRYLESTFSHRFSNDVEVTEADINDFYIKNSSQFQVPSAVRAGVIELHVNAKGNPEKLEEARALAKTLHAQATQATDEEFRRLVQLHSEDQSTRYIGGDTGWLREGDQSTRWDAAVRRAALTLKTRGEVAPVLATSNCFRIIRLLERQEAGARPLREVADSIRYQLLQAGRRDREAAFTEELTNGLKIVMHREMLNTIPDPVHREQTPPSGLPGITSK